MATIDIKRSHSLALETAKSRAEELAKDLETKLGITWSWSGNTIDFSAKSGVAKGVKGKIDIDGSQVHVAIDLPFLMKAMKGTLVGKVEAKLDKLTAPE